MTDSNIQKAWIKFILMECCAKQVPEATPDHPAVTGESIQEVLGHNVPLDDITELDCDRGTDASEVMTDDVILEYVTESPQNDVEDPEEAMTRRNIQYQI